MTLHKGTALAIAIFITGSASMAHAQTVAASLRELEGKLKPGSTVSVTDDHGRKAKGRLAELSPGSVKLLVDGKERTFLEETVREIKEHRRNTAPGFGAGLAGGIILGVLAGLAVPVNSEQKAEAVGIGVLLFGGAGAGVGAAIGAATTNTQVRYQAAAPAPGRVTIAPLAGAHAIGIGARVRF